MKKTNLKLEKLKVESFTTSQNKEVKAGSPGEFFERLGSLLYGSCYSVNYC